VTFLCAGICSIVGNWEQRGLPHQVWWYYQNLEETLVRFEGGYPLLFQNPQGIVNLLVLFVVLILLQGY
jgi:hypothetical protein